MPPFGPVTRNELIYYLHQLGFTSPYAGGKHQFSNHLAPYHVQLASGERFGHDHRLGHSNLQESQLVKVDSDTKEGAGRNDDQGRDSSKT